MKHIAELGGIVTGFNQLELDEMLLIHLQEGLITTPGSQCALEGNL